MISLNKLEKKLEGRLIRKETTGYDESRKQWNYFFDFRPAAIAFCQNTNDVIECVNFVRENSIEFSVRSGGHDYSGKSVIDDGLVIDLSRLNSIRINPEKRTALAESGNTWGRFDEEAQKHGLATTGGTVSTVGIAGYTLGGGTGYLARKHGLAVDNLLSAEVITASGSLLRVNEIENQDLFWAIRGGGGNFGIVTSLEYRLHETGPEVMAGQVVHLFENAEKVLRFYGDFMQDAPDELTCYAFFLNVPPVDFFPEKMHGKTALFLIMCHIGPVEKAREELKPLLEFGNPELNTVQSMAYTAAQKMFDEGMGKGNRWYTRALMVDTLSEAAIKKITKFTESIPGSLGAAYLEPMNGEIQRVESSATAFPHRSSAFGMHIFPGWTDTETDLAPMQWARDFYSEMSSYSNNGVYVNLLAHDEPERVKQAYGDNFEELSRIKRKYDPENLFSNNHNITPAE